MRSTTVRLGFIDTRTVVARERTMLYFRAVLLMFLAIPCGAAAGYAAVAPNKMTIFVPSCASLTCVNGAVPRISAV